MAVDVCSCDGCSIGFQYAARAFQKCCVIPNVILVVGVLFDFFLMLLRCSGSLCVLCSIMCVSVFGRIDAGLMWALPLLALLSQYDGDDDDDEPTKTAATTMM